MDELLETLNTEQAQPHLTVGLPATKPHIEININIEIGSVTNDNRHTCGGSGNSGAELEAIMKGGAEMLSKLKDAGKIDLAEIFKAQIKAEPTTY